MLNEKITVARDESLLLVADLLARALDLSRDEVFALVLKQYIDHDPDCRRVIMAMFDQAYGDEALSEEEAQVLEGQYWEYVFTSDTERPMAKTDVRVSLPGWLLIDLKVVTAKLDISRDDLIAQALRRYIEQEGRQLLLERVDAALAPVAAHGEHADNVENGDHQL